MTRKDTDHRGTPASRTEVYPSQGNFVFARGTTGPGGATPWRGWASESARGQTHDALRRDPHLMPLRPRDDAVCRAIATVAEPRAILFDMDGVLADVSRSYRVAINRLRATSVSR